MITRFGRVFAALCLALALAVPPQDGARAQAAMALYVVENGQQAGPYGSEQVVQRIVGGQLRQDTLVWMDGMSGWMPAGQVPMLAPLFQQAGGGQTTAPPPLPTPPAPGPAPGPTTGPTAGQPADYAQFLVGRWVSERTQMPIDGVGMGMAVFDFTFRQGSAYDARAEIAAQWQGQNVTIVTSSQGTFTTRPGLRDGAFEWNPQGIITTEIRGNGTTMPGDVAQATPIAFQVVDQNTIVGDGQITMRRQ